MNKRQSRIQLLPLENPAQRPVELGEGPERPIAIVCRTDRRSAKAAALLAQRGFADVHVIRDGMAAWLERGWPCRRAKAALWVER